MTVASLQFVAALLLASVLFPLLPTPRARQGALFLGNCVFLGSLVPNAATWAALAAFLASGYAAARILERRPVRALLAAYVAGIVAVFVVLKRYAFLEQVVPPAMLDHPITIVGLSYMLFRQIHYVVDSMQGQIPTPSLWGYLNYQMNLFGLLAGPIQRYQEFQASWDKLVTVATDQHDLLKRYLRVFWGVVKIVGIAAAFSFAYQKLFARLESLHAASDTPGLLTALVLFLGVFYLYPLYMYFNFSGYCDIVIGGAALVGLRLPENFDRPYLSRSVIDFWTRWHRTLGFWIRDYLFMPMYKAVAERNPRVAPSVAFGCYFVAFALAGIWHGTTSNFLVFGAINGLGASAAKLGEQYLIRKRGRAGLRQYLQSGRIRLVSIWATANFFCVSMLFFPHELERCLIPLRVLSAALEAAIRG